MQFTTLSSGAGVCHVVDTAEIENPVGDGDSCASQGYRLAQESRQHNKVGSDKQGFRACERFLTCLDVAAIHTLTKKHETRTVASIQNSSVVRCNLIHISNSCSDSRTSTAFTFTSYVAGVSTLGGAAVLRATG